MIPNRSNLSILLLFLCLPVASYSQQAKAPATDAPVAAASASTIQPATEAPKTPAEFLVRARQLSDLEAAGVPFHLKATFVSTGNAGFTGNGTFEEWWESDKVWRKEASLGDYRMVALSSQKGPSLYATSPDIPAILFDAMDRVLIRIAPDTGAFKDLAIEQKKIGGVELTALSVKPRRKPDGTVFAGSTDYFDSNGVLRVQRSSGQVTVYNDFQAFQGLQVPRTIGATFGNKRSLKISIELLEPLSTGQTMTSKLVTAPDGVPLIGNYLVVSPRVMADRLVHSAWTEYPDLAKRERIQGTVTLSIVVDESGNVSNVRVMQSAGQMLDNAAITAVRQYRYEPPTVGGNAYPVKTTISFHFALRE